MRCVRINDPEAFDKQIAAALDESSNVFVLFFGRENAHGVSWCPDCVIADPKVRTAIGKIKDAILLEVPVDRKSDTTSATHIFRQRSDTRLEKVPTLLRWTSSGPSQDRLEENKCNEQDIAIYVAETALQHSQ
ncbi:hypothetical protein LPJ78_002369 [Coemansia sp. RSA 989]|nr:hypothetical protein BX667DRAFT_52395 [Coemansia mojavensis]KAJ1742723.1 hypothetical protein LPJ68_001602 [Coemansia sp. RSA 1086]KAJ1751334.1 hypothetical protein LPJ79_002115 [Coemansia sp. RSA 1821]KAJ1865874.1 hypothetical protein LPJ78_002369 [Coemansia sp. RSA 989]KAJ1873125.1 hypothetical protein LPJ55_002591 [Coemansia sp. RSA 990]KAJ2633333.1 hypothetical protein H4R22_000521 [Coemansia sp. RSA 1290]KAJ2647816.1 hypothetical protein IWW40_004438 [Coemansia sp. RSA 1250]KAJ266990